MKSKGSIISKIQYILGFIGVMALGILSLVSFIDKNDNVSYINSVVTKSINYTQKSYVSKDIEYKSEITIKFDYEGKEYETVTNESGTYLAGDDYNTYIYKDNPQELAGSSPYIDLLVSIFFFIVALGLLCLSNTVKNIIKNIYYKISDRNENKELYTDVFHDTTKKSNGKKMFYKVGLFVSFIGAIVLIVFSVYQVKMYINYNEKQTYNTKVKVVEILDNNAIVSWNDEENKQHLEYVTNNNYQKNDELFKEVEKNTDNSRTVTRKVDMKILFGGLIASIAISSFFVYCIVKLRKLKKI